MLRTLATSLTAFSACLAAAQPNAAEPPAPISYSARPVLGTVEGEEKSLRLITPDYKFGPLLTSSAAFKGALFMILRGDRLERFPDGNLPSGKPPRSSFAVAWNPHGLLVGHADHDAFLYDGDRTTWLAPPGKDFPAGDVYRRVVGVSDDGTVLGITGTGPSPSSHGVAWRFQKGSYTRLGLTDPKYHAPDGRLSSAAIGISPSGVIVGYSRLWSKERGPAESPGVRDGDGFWRGGAAWILEEETYRELTPPEATHAGVPYVFPEQIFPAGEVHLRTLTAHHLFSNGKFNRIGPPSTLSTGVVIHAWAPDLKACAGVSIDVTAEPPRSSGWAFAEGRTTTVGLTDSRHSASGQPRPSTIKSVWPDGSVVGFTPRGSVGGDASPWLAKAGQTQLLGLQDAAHQTTKGPVSTFADMVDGRWIAGRSLKNSPAADATFSTGWLYDAKSRKTITIIHGAKTPRGPKWSTLPAVLLADGTVLLSWSDETATPASRGVAAWRPGQPDIPLSITIPSRPGAAIDALGPVLRLAPDGSRLLAMLEGSTPDGKLSGWWLLERRP